jgi:hypothetical protein
MLAWFFLGPSLLRSAPSTRTLASNTPLQTPAISPAPEAPTRDARRELEEISP